jgi:hypothetical protein
MTGAAGKTGAAGMGAGGSTGAAGSPAGAAGTGVVMTGAAGTGVVVPTGGANLCAGLVTDKLAHPMTALAQPALYATVTDAEFKTTIRRITQVPATGSDPALRPMYSTVSTWNADESLMILYNVSHGHELYDGKTYKFIRKLSDISPADIEQVYWHTSDPDIFFYVDGKQFIRYHVAAAMKEVLTTFACTGSVSGGSDPMFTSYDSKRIGLGCDGNSFIYDISTNQVLAKKPYNENPVQASPSGQFGWFDESGRVTDMQLNVMRTLDLANPANHSSMVLTPSGVDNWIGVVFDNGPKGDDDIGSLVTYDMTTGKSKVIIGQKTGYPYPTTTHVSGLGYKNPGYAVVTTLGDLTGKGLLDLEVLIGNIVDGTVCRVGRHRSWGKSNTHLADSYWAEAHSTPSPSGTRIVFASDWGNTATVDSYVIELPTYKP